MVLWILYAKSYNEQGNRGVFLIGILPIWELTKEEIQVIIDNIRIIWSKEYFYPATQIIFMIGLLFIWIRGRHADKSLLIITSLLFVAFLSIIILFFSPLGQHDYYVIDLLILSVFIMLSAFSILKHNNVGRKIMASNAVKIIAILFLILNLNHTRGKMINRYLGWQNQRHLTEFYGYEDLENYLDSMNIDRSARFISVDDPSINITLYLMNRKGWSGYGTNMHDSASVARRIEMGANYMVFHKPLDLEKDPHWKYFMKEEVGTFENVTICKVGLPE
jgi:hypothetical protein